ncbi:MAG: hypothetical protein H7039_22810 [Bryobacteraceae bacterium]|nr:hypothetical protein [Bryobacteraceae bacterium]
MNQTATDQACIDTLRQLDAFLDRSVSITETAAIESHLHSCLHCLQELVLRQQLRDRLRQAVLSESPSSHLETRILANVRSASRASIWESWRYQTVAATAVLAIVIGAGLSYEVGHLRFTAASQDAFLSSISSRINVMFRPGLNDHVHCAVFRKYPSEVPNADALIAGLSDEYRDLLPAVRSVAGKDFEILMAHECSYEDRGFVHIAMRTGTHLASLVIARKKDGETFATAGLISTLEASGSPVYSEDIRGYAISASETKDYLMYVVSSLPPARNSSLLAALTPGIRRVLTRSES